jgi:hypothetical protein
MLIENGTSEFMVATPTQEEISKIIPGIIL